MFIILNILVGSLWSVAKVDLLNLDCLMVLGVVNGKASFTSEIKQSTLTTARRGVGKVYYFVFYNS